MTWKYFISAISIVIPISVVLLVSALISRYFGLLDDVQSVPKKFMIVGLIFLVTFPAAIALCKIWGRFLLKIKMIDVVQAKQFPFYRP
jgi:hypothetical protein